MKRILDLTYDEIVIGSDLSALCYAYINSVPIVYLRHKKPHPFEQYDEKTLSNDKWNHLMFLISLNNLSPFSDTAQSIRLIDDNNLRIVTKQNFICNIKFNKLIISDDYKINGLPSSNKKTNTKNLVIDWFRVISGRKHSYDRLESRTKFVQMVNFYSPNENNNKDLYTFSYLSDAQIAKPDYSEAIVRIKIIRMLKEAKIKPDSLRTLRIEHQKREVYSLGKNVYNNLSDNIKFLYDSPQEIMKNTKKENKYLDYLERIINAKRAS